MKVLCAFPSFHGYIHTEIEAKRISIHELFGFEITPKDENALDKFYQSISCPFNDCYCGGVDVNTNGNNIFIPQSAFVGVKM